MVHGTAHEARILPLNPKSETAGGVGKARNLQGKLMDRYEVGRFVGAGGMGEVYQARDERIGRDVAIKLLPPAYAADAMRLARFEQEARAAGSLNHPNVVTVYDIGNHEGSPFVVSELLEGETLRTALMRGPVPLRKVLDFAVQVARGMAAAHDKGIVHRDVKPENIFITTDGRAKILDFGLAKLLYPEASESGEDLAPEVSTQTGMMVGTVGYMSPEQVRGGRNIDHRSDIFSFGVVLYEMLTGKRAFAADSAVETMHAILKDEPPAPGSEARPIPPVLERMLDHCLEKDRERRYQSARDLAFDLEMLSGVTATAVSGVAIPGPPGRRKWVAAAVLAGLVAAAALTYIARKETVGVSNPAYRQLTFRRGTVWSARFAPDGATVLYSSSWSGAPLETYATTAAGREARALEFPDAELLSVSSNQELAILVRRKYFGHLISRGTLARMPMAGSAPREILEDVQQADWSPDGSQLAVIRIVNGRSRLEYPVDKVLYEADGWLSYARVSPTGDEVAFFEHPVDGDNRGWVMVVDRAGKAKKLSREWVSAQGLAWSPEGKEVWFSASKLGEAYAVYAVSREGVERLVKSAPVDLVLHDVSREGKLLVASGVESTDFAGQPPEAARERDFAWLDVGSLRDFSADGRTLVFTHFGGGSGSNYTVYLAKTDGSPAVRLGEGNGWGLSPDGQWVITQLFDPPTLTLLRTGAGSPRNLPRGQIAQYGLGASWLPDGKRVLFLGQEAGRALRCYVQDIEGGPPRAVTPEGVVGTVVSPDGKYVIAAAPGQKRALYPIEGGSPVPLPGLEDQDNIIRWAADGRSLFTFQQSGLPVRIYRLDVASGRRELWREVTPSDPTGILPFFKVFVAADGKAYVYSFTRSLFRLFLVEGLT